MCNDVATWQVTCYFKQQKVDIPTVGKILSKDLILFFLNVMSLTTVINT